MSETDFIYLELNSYKNKLIDSKMQIEFLTDMLEKMTKKVRELEEKCRYNPYYLKAQE